MRSRFFLTIAACLLAAASPARAQDRPGDGIIEPPGAPRPLRGLFGGSLYYAQPVGEFADYVARGFGGDLAGTWMLGPSGAFGLRFEGGLVNYGNDTEPVCLLDCRFDADLTTTNNIFFFGVGPQLVATTGAVRPYVGATVGWTWIWTSSRLEGTWDGAAYDENTDYSDNTPSWGGNAGLLVPLSAGGNPIMLDLGVRYLQNGRARYLREGDIIENPSGGLPFYNVQESDANLLTYRVGLSFGIR
jgi:opacity protein-like surface antigen